MSPQGVFQSWVGSKLCQSWLGSYPLLTTRLSEFGWIWAIHSISTIFQCLIVSMMNGFFARLRFEFIIHNHHHTLWLLSRGCRQDRLRQYPLFHTKMVIQDFHIISTYPTSHYKYDKTALPAVQFVRSL